MDNWTEWFDRETATDLRGPLNFFGIYQVQIVGSSGKPLRISRLCGVDSEGTIYYGRSGLQHKSSHRTIANRINEFFKGQHSGGKTYARIKPNLDRQFRAHSLKVRGLKLLDMNINGREALFLNKYLNMYGELPPCNSSLPKIAAYQDV